MSITEEQAVDQYSWCLLERLCTGLLLCERCFPASCKPHAVLNHTDRLVRFCPGLQKISWALQLTHDLVLFCQCLYFSSMSLVLWYSETDSIAINTKLKTVPIILQCIAYIQNNQHFSQLCVIKPVCMTAIFLKTQIKSTVTWILK